MRYSQLLFLTVNVFSGCLGNSFGVASVNSDPAEDTGSASCKITSSSIIDLQLDFSPFLPLFAFTLCVVCIKISRLAAVDAANNKDDLIV